MIEAHFSVPPHIHQVDLIPLLLKPGQRAADRGVFQRRGDDMLSEMPLRPGDAFDREIVRLAGAGGEDDLRWNDVQKLRNGICGLCKRFPRRLPGRVIGIRIPDVFPLGTEISVQHGGVCRRIRAVVKIDHGDSPV